MHTVKHVSGGILWANLHLLFWLSLIPFVTGWMGENHFQKQPTALYGIVLLMAAIAYFILQKQIIKVQCKNAVLAKALGTDIKGKISPALYVIGIAFSWYLPWVSGIFYIIVALMWLIPDARS